MKLSTVLTAFGVLVVLATPVFAQPILPPYTEDFETEVQCSTSPLVACPLLGLWTNLLTDDIDWRSDAGGTSSSGTGPSIDHNPGTATGFYLYLESSLTGGNPLKVANLLSPEFDRTGVTAPRASWWYHMYGTSQGTMHLDLLERLNAGTDGVVATAGISFGSMSATFTPAHVGSQIIVSGSVSGNDGTYTIVTYLGPNAVDVDIPFVMAETGLTFTHQVLTQDIITPFTDNQDLWQQQIVSLLPHFIGGGNSNIFQLIIRGITGTSFGSDMAIDDFIYDQPPTDDVGAISVDAPPPFVQAGFHPVTVTIENFGQNTQTSIPVSYDVDGGTPVTETYMGSIPTGGTDTYTFTTLADLSVLGPHTITAFTTLMGDGDPTNDGSSAATTSAPTIAAFPYTEDFEGGQGNWASGGLNDSWAFGTPAKTQIIGAASGVNCWVPGGLIGLYPDNENSQVTGPYFDFTGMSLPLVQLSIWVECEDLWDGANVQTSIDNGLSWQNVGAFGDPNNWYNDNGIDATPGGSLEGWTGSAVNGTGTGGWVIAKNVMPTLAGQTAVLIRVAFGSDTATQDEGFAFDDILVMDSPPPYPGTTASDLVLGTGVNGPATSGVGQYIKTATAFDNFVLEMSSPGGSYDLQPFVLLAQPFTTGTPPMGPLPTVWIDLNLPFAILIDFDPIFSQLIVPGGTSFGAVIPPGFVGQSFMFQGACVTPAFAVTDGYEFQIL